MNLKKIPQQAFGALALSLLLIMPALALDLGEAKSKGLVGETSKGYIAAVKPSGEVNALVKDINTQRKAHYQKIATKNNISLEAVEARAGQKAISKTPPGQYVNSGAGWRNK